MISAGNTRNITVIKNTNMKILLSSSLRQYMIVIMVNLGVLSTGVSLGWPSPVIVKLRNGTDTPLSRPITVEEGSWIVSGGYLAAIVSNLLGGMLVDGIGRKCCIVLVSIPKLLVAIWTVFATEVWILTLCRSVMVACDMFILIVVPVYASEIASKEHRGTLGVLLHIFSCLGVVIALSIGPFLSYVALNTFIAGLIAVTTVPVLFLPESPFYLYSKGRHNDAIKILFLVRDSDVTINKEIEEYKISSKEDVIDKKTLFTNRLFVKALFLGLLLCGGSNLIGYNAVSLYLQTILESTKTSLRPDFASVIIGCIQLFAASCTSFIMNKFGRRTILISSLSGMFCGMLGLGTYFKLIETDGYIVTGFMNYLPLISLTLIIYCYSFGIGTLLFVVTAEVFDGPTRAIGVSICLSVGGVTTFLTTKYFAQVTYSIGPAITYYLFSAMCVLLCALIIVFMPETKGKTFNEIQTELDKKLIHIQCTRKNSQALQKGRATVNPVV